MKAEPLVFRLLSDSMTRGVETLTDGVSEAFFEPVIRVGVTGLARAGKTVFITSLIANLMDRGRMPGLQAETDNRIAAAFLRPQPDVTVPRFEFESHLQSLTASEPSWPDSTRSISELRLSLRVRPTGLLGGLQGPRTVHIDIIDYPGEWLLDLGLMDQSYADWSTRMLERIKGRPGAEDYLNLAISEDALAPLDETRARSLAKAYSRHLHDARAAGYSDCAPGRFLLPGDLEGSPVLTFAPLPAQASAPRRSLWRELERRFEAYKTKVVGPFFKEHFARLDRQIVLVDALGAIHAGPAAVEDLRRTLADILGSFRPGRNAWLTSMFLGKRVERILFAATKADHLHHTQHDSLTHIMETLVREASDRAAFSGAETKAMAIASLRATVEETLPHEGQVLNCVRGTLLDTGKQAAFFPGELPTDPQHILGPARAGAQRWLDRDYQIMRFAPARLTRRPGEGPPHIRLDQAAQFLIGDRL
jgi:predicted YcjX-like family ATPase